MSKVAISPIRVVIEQAPASMYPVVQLLTDRTCVVCVRGLPGGTVIVTKKAVTPTTAAKVKARVEEYLDAYRKPKAKTRAKKPKAKTSWERITSGDTV
jgi:hypothetical protein